MPTSSTRALAFALGVLGASSGCRTKACSTIGCQAQFSATITGTNGAFPSGTHKIDVTADGTLFSCSFAFPLQTLPSGGTASTGCLVGLTVDVIPATSCATKSTDAADTSQCTAIPGQFVEQITVTGMPVQVRVQQSVDGTAVLDKTAIPSYQAVQPNGPGCDPICEQATESWTLSQ